MIKGDNDRQGSGAKIGEVNTSVSNEKPADGYLMEDRND